MYLNIFLFDFFAERQVDSPQSPPLAAAIGGFDSAADAGPEFLECRIIDWFTRCCESVHLGLTGIAADVPGPKIVVQFLKGITQGGKHPDHGRQYADGHDNLNT